MQSGLEEVNTERWAGSADVDCAAMRQICNKLDVCQM